MIPTLLLAALPLAGPGEPPALQTRLRSVALFKNGYAFHVREADCPPVASIDLAPLPVPVHGTFWIASDPRRLELLEAVGSRHRWRERVPVTNIHDLLRVNVGKEVLWHRGQEAPLRARIRRITEGPTDEGRTRSASGSEVGLVFLQTPTGEVAITPGALGYSLESADGPFVDQIDAPREGIRLSLKLEPRASGPTPLFVSYLAAGASWAPSYALDISGPARARITAKAEVFSEEEDLEDTEVWFVTGFPNLGYRAATSPIAMRGTLPEFLQSLSRPAGEEAHVLRQMAVAERAEAFPVVEGATGGQQTEDLFFYERKGVTLRKGQRGYYPLFTASVPYEDVYEWSIPDTLPAAPTYGRREDPKPEVVWHSLRLTNDTQWPWTTAPAMTMKDGQFLAQDVLHYTARGARTILRMTQASDIAAEAAEVETARERGAATIYGTRYDLVTVQGELRLTNHKSEAVTVEVSKLLSGEIVETPGGAEVQTLARGLRRVNPNQRLFLRITIGPRTTVPTRYVYRLYVTG